MKNILKTLMLALPIVAGCSSEEVYQKQTAASTLPAPQVFVQGKNLIANGDAQDAETKAAYQYPYCNVSEGYETAHFFIRNDGKVPDFYDYSSAFYYGFTKDGNNLGKVYPLYPFGHYNDRDYDYYKVDKKTGNNIGLFRYVYDKNGYDTQAALLEIPKITDILMDDRAKYEEAGNTAQVAKIDEYLAKGEDYLSKHVLWYVVKEVGSQYYWHVDGTFVDYEVPAYSVDKPSVPNHVEIDIHHQEHKDWNEIKTSIHIRADIENISVNLPISQDNLQDITGFHIRVYNFYYKDYVVSHEIVQDEKGVTINISNIPASLIEELKNNIKDGLTVEVHTFCNTGSTIWSELQNSKVVKLGKPCNVIGQITSAHNDEEYPIYVQK